MDFQTKTMTRKAHDRKSIAGGSLPSASVESIAAEMGWLSELIEARMRSFLGGGIPEDGPAPQPPVALRSCRYSPLLRKHNMELPERLLLALATAPSMNPALLDGFRTKNANTGEGFAEFGGTRGVNHAGFLPTGETALFLLAGGDLEKRCALLHLFEPDHYFYRENILAHGLAAPHEPLWSAPLGIAPAFLRYLATGEWPAT